MIPGFSRLSVSGYRRLKAVDIPLRPLNVLIGANGVGKSSFLDVFRSAGGIRRRHFTMHDHDSGGYGIAF